MFKFTPARKAGAAIVGAVSIVGIAATAASAASTPNAAQTLKSPTTMKVYARGGALTFVNVLQSKSLGVGDEIIITQPAFAGPHSTKVIGHSYVTLQFVTKTASLVEADLTLKNGSIELSGINPNSGSPAPFRLAVVGGTGSYANARGQATVVSGQGKTNPATFNVSLLP